MDKSAISRILTLPAGRYAPGHLSELTQQVPFEMVDAVLRETHRVQRRVRGLPSRVVVYLLLGGCLFEGLGYRQVWQRLAAGLGGLCAASPTASAMSQARRRLGPAPLRELFFLLRGPAPQSARWRGWLVCAVDGTLLTVADSPANLAVYRKQRGGPTGGGSYPTLRLLALVSCGTRTVVDAAFGPSTAGEAAYAAQLARSLHAGMLLLADRGFGAAFLARAAAGTGAQVLVRVRAGKGAPALPVLARLPDGSWLTRSAGIPVRALDAQLTITTSAGRTAVRCRLVTTLLDPGRYPAADLAALYHERWEIETCYFELKSTLLGGRVLRARTPDGIEQEVWALLVTYQALRTAIADAAATRPGTDPSRASFTVALNTARDQLVLAAGVTSGPDIDLAGTIGRSVLAALMPPRRPRTSPRVVKRAISKYNARGTIDRTTRTTRTTITVLTPDDEP